MIEMAAQIEPYATSSLDMKPRAFFLNFDDWWEEDSRKEEGFRAVPSTVKLEYLEYSSVSVCTKVSKS